MKLTAPDDVFELINILCRRGRRRDGDGVRALLAIRRRAAECPGRGQDARHRRGSLSLYWLQLINELGLFGSRFREVMWHPPARES